MLRTLFLMLVSALVAVVSFYGVLGGVRSEWQEPFWATTLICAVVALIISAV